jgi:hypothetical protein
MQQRAVPGFEEVDPPDGLAVHVARLGQAAKRTNPGREVVQSGEVGEIAPVTVEQDLTQIDQAVDALLDRSQRAGRRAVTVFPPFPWSLTGPTRARRCWKSSKSPPRVFARLSLRGQAGEGWWDLSATIDGVMMPAN